MKYLWILVLCFTQIVQANIFGGKTGVRELSPSTFKKEVLLNGNVSIVAFYAPWCGYCQKLAPELKKTAKSLKGIARVSAVNCDNPLNQQLCQRYKVQGFPTIKVFQPAKLTDVDFKDVSENKPVPRRKPKMFPYNGERTAASLTKFALGKLRNYVATLNSDDALQWMAPNLVPRVLMLPGKKYKSKTISPLFKVLSREYFGKMRFATIPRRVDGAWNLLGLQAPEESQLVYMSDDRDPVIYKGSMKKKPIKRFLEEQYNLEMQRRKKSGKSQIPDREKAANGLEYVDEDAQNEELEHVAKRKEMLKNERAKALQAKIDAYRRAGVDFDESELRAEFESKNQKEDIKKQKTEGSEDEEYLVDFEIDELSNKGDNTEDSQDNLDTDYSAVENEDDDDEAALDETIIEVTPDQMVNEGPDALSKYLSSLKIAQNTEEQKIEKRATATGPSRPGITNTDTSVTELGIRSYDTFVKRCFRRGLNCAVATVHNESIESDLLNFARAVKDAPKSWKQDTLFEFIVLGQDSDLDDFVSSIDSTQVPGLFRYDSLRRKVNVMNKGWNKDDIFSFLKDNHEGKVKAETQIPSKYLYWITQEEVKAQVAKKKAKDQSTAEIVKDEL